MRDFFRHYLTSLPGPLNPLGSWKERLREGAQAANIRGRLFFLMGTFFTSFGLISFRLADLMIHERTPRPVWRAEVGHPDGGMPRADILDRNGTVLATHVVTASAYVDAREIQDANEAVEALHTVFPEISLETLRTKVTSGKAFVWLARHLTPKRQDALQHLGLPGVYLRKDFKRVYPLGNLASHLIGFCGVDGNGLSGVERSFESYLLQSLEPLRLSLDVRVQHIVLELLQEAIQEFKAIGGNALVMDAQTGEILAMESLPTFDLNTFQKVENQEALFNRNTLGVYEMGSVFKVLNVAIALESGKVTKQSQFDVREPIKIGRFTVTDFRGQNRILNLEEAFVYSSNIAAVKIAQQFGGAETQQRFFSSFGVFDPVELEVAEMGRPIYASRWTNATMMASSYGYGIAVSPLRLLSTINGIANGGVLVSPTLLCGKTPERKRIVSPKTSQDVRAMMRKVIANGTARKADVPGYRVFGKTGTAYKNKQGRYDANKARRTVFVGGFPVESPRYMVLFMLDEPKPTKQTFGYATAGWNVTPYGGKLIERIAPLLGVKMATEAEANASSHPASEMIQRTEFKTPSRAVNSKRG